MQRSSVGVVNSACVSSSGCVECMECVDYHAQCVEVGRSVVDQADCTIVDVLYILLDLLVDLFLHSSGPFFVGGILQNPENLPGYSLALSFSMIIITDSYL